MDSILGTIFLKVQERLTTKVPELKWVDQDLGQLEFHNGRPAVAFPCALIDLDDTSYSDEGENSQIADSCILLIRLGLLVYSEASHLTPQLYKEKALEYYNLEHRVNQQLHGWCDSQYFTPMMRRRGYKEKRDDNLRVRVLRYEFAFRDSTAMEVTSTIARPELDFI